MLAAHLSGDSLENRLDCGNFAEVVLTGGSFTVTEDLLGLVGVCSSTVTRVSACSAIPTSGVR